MARINPKPILADDQQIFNVYLNKELQKQLEGGTNAVSLPDVERRYGVPVVFPDPSKERPYIYSSIALSADGKMGFMDNRNGQFVSGKNFRDPDGAKLDYWVLNLLRAYSDGLLIGANTLRNEPKVVNYVRDFFLNEQRRTILGKKDHPVNIVVSLDGTDIPDDHVSFGIDPEERFKLMIATSPAGYEYLQKDSGLRIALLGRFQNREEVDQASFPPLLSDFSTFPVLVTGTGSEPDTKLLLYALRKMGFEYLCAESPTYTAVLLKEQCLDEYFITYSMVYAGGTMTPGHFVPQSFEKHVHSDLVSVGMHASNFLFTRQKLVYDP